MSVGDWAQGDDSRLRREPRSLRTTVVNGWNKLRETREHDGDGITGEGESGVAQLLQTEEMQLRGLRGS